MKSHISATIEENLLRRVDRYRRSVKRSRSQVIEIAVERLLDSEETNYEEIVSSSGQFNGSFSRAETYER